MKKRKREYNWLEDAKRRREQLRGKTRIDLVSWVIILVGLGVAASLIWYYGPQV